MKSDIQNREDIRHLVITFTERLLKDKVFKHFFIDVAKVDMLEHIDRVIDFWDNLLFNSGTYQGDLLDIHLELHFKHKIKNEYLKEWIDCFNTILDDLFEGEMASKCKVSALSIASIIKMKIDNIERRRLEINN